MAINLTLLPHPPSGISFQSHEVFELLLILVKGTTPNSLFHLLYDIPLLVFHGEFDDQWVVGKPSIWKSKHQPG